MASHSLSHPYDLFKLKEPGVELQYSRQQLEDATGTQVKGFRSPGYNVSPRLLAEIARHYRYDSSILPSPPYFLARAAVIGTMRLTGRRSASFVGRFSQFAKGWRPFAWKVEDGLLPELPMSAVFGFPVIGTTLATGGFAANKALKILKKREFINLEFHAIDFMDTADGLEEELTVEPALRIPLALRLERFSKALEFLKTNRNTVTLARAVETLNLG